MTVAASLRSVPGLTDLSEDLLAQLAGELRERRFGAGEWIIRAGERGESLFVVQSGRVEILDEGPPELLIRTLRRGDVVGELALLHDGTRSASVRAARDSHLLELGRARCERLVGDAPGFALGIARSIAAQLAVSRAPVHATARPRVVAVTALDRGPDPAAVADRLAATLRAFGSVGVLHVAPGAPPGEMLARLERAERYEDRVVVVAPVPDPDDPWTGFCLREADRIVALTTSGTPSPGWRARPAVLRGCELFVTHRASAARLAVEFAARELHVLADAGRLDSSLEVLGRRLAGRSLGVVLSGGGARALAHLGVLDELRAAGLTPDRIGGVSLGGLIGALEATGWEPGEVEDIVRRGFVETDPSDDFVLPAYSLIRGGKARRLLQETFGDLRIEELPRRFFCLSCDLLAREAIEHRTGPLWEAVYTSLAIPGVFPAVPTPDGRLLVDGGVLDNLPVAAMARTGEGPVIAVDVTGRFERVRRSPRPVPRRIGALLRRALTGTDAPIPRLGETVLRTLLVGSADTVAAAKRHADLAITPDTTGIGLLDWDRLPAAREAGRRAAREAREAAPAGLAL
jgi:predicted acylesterase/phospholipase RssA/CRP-like cAMP-binding protein